MKEFRLFNIRSECVSCELSFTFLEEEFIINSLIEELVAYGMIAIVRRGEFCWFLDAWPGNFFRKGVFCGFMNKKEKRCEKIHGKTRL
jgi:hypothetical protein